VALTLSLSPRGPATGYGQTNQVHAVGGVPSGRRSCLATDQFDPAVAGRWCDADGSVVRRIGHSRRRVAPREINCVGRWCQRRAKNLTLLVPRGLRGEFERWSPTVEGSVRRRGVERFHGCLPAEDLAGAVVQPVLGLGQVLGCVDAQDAAFGEVLPEQAVGVLVGATQRTPARRDRRRLGSGAPRAQPPTGQDCTKASRSALIVSASVVGMPCGNPG
jgi:hypothetical protein